MPSKRRPNPMPPAERGYLGARRRWGPRRILNLGDLSREQREIVNALVDVQRAANEQSEER